MNFSLVTAEIAVVVLAALVIVFDLLIPFKETRRSLGYMTVFGLAAVLLMISGSSVNIGIFSDSQYAVDGYALFFKQLFLVATALVLLFSFDFTERLPRYQGEFYALIAFSVLGMMMMASANDFLTLFVGLGVMNVCFYILVSYHLGNYKSSEAGVKYLVLSAASAGIMLYGMSLVYGVTGSLQLSAVRAALTSPALLVGIGMILIGLGFKIAAVPFHIWSPDIYEGAPLPITALLAVCSKLAAFAALLRIFLQAVPAWSASWLPVILVLAVLSMTAGNLMAMHQMNIKRLLAYSSIAQAGYLLCGLVAESQAGVKGILFYGMIYVFASAGAFAVLTAVKLNSGAEDLRAFSGLAQKSPLLAAVMTVSLLSMAGIPPMAGFAGKLYLFIAVVESGYLWLALLGFVMSMISVYYYLLVAKAMYLGEVDSWRPFTVSSSLQWAALVSLAITLFCGIYPGPLATLAAQAAGSLF